VATTTLSGGFLSVTGPYWRMMRDPTARAMGVICTLGIFTVTACALGIAAAGWRRVGLRRLASLGDPGPTVQTPQSS
jgi:hypothetical protein